MKFASAGAVDSVGLLFCGDRVNSQFFVLSVFIAMDTNCFCKKKTQVLQQSHCEVFGKRKVSDALGKAE